MRTALVQATEGPSPGVAAGSASAIRAWRRAGRQASRYDRSMSPRPSASACRRRRPPNRSAWVELARRVEAHGYATLTMPDHFTDQLAPVPALMAAADATTSLRVGALVLDNDYQHPVVLAKELATIDLLSDGRLEIGIGAGWMRTDYDAAGLPYDSAGVRIDRFVEGLRRPQGPVRPTGRSRFAGQALHGAATWTGCPSRCSGRGRRSSSAAVVAACWPSRRARPTSSGINGTHAPRARSTPTRWPRMAADAVDEKLAWVREARRRPDRPTSS